MLVSCPECPQPIQPLSFDVASASALRAYLEASPLALLRLSMSSPTGEVPHPFPALVHKPRALPPQPMPPGVCSPAAARDDPISVSTTTGDATGADQAQAPAASVSESALAAGHTVLVEAVIEAHRAPGTTVVRSPLLLRRRSVPDSGAAGCILDEAAGLATKNCQVETATYSAQ